MRRLHGLGLAAFCLISGSRWLVDMAAPSDLPILLEQSLHYAVLSFLTFIAWLLRSPRELRRTGASWIKVSLAGIILLTLPALFSAWPHGRSAVSAPALFTLAPLLIVVASSCLAGFAGDRAKMFPALAGATGGLLALPLRFPANLQEIRSFLLIFVIVALIAIANVWAYLLFQKGDLLWIAGVICASSSLVMGGFALRTPLATPQSHSVLSEILRSCLLDLPLLLLLLWLIREMTPVRLSSRFLLVPLVTIFEGLVLLRPQVDLRLGSGLLLIMGSAAILNLGMVEQEHRKSSMLGLF